MSARHACVAVVAVVAMWCVIYFWLGPRTVERFKADVAELRASGELPR